MRYLRIYILIFLVSGLFISCKRNIDADILIVNGKVYDGQSNTPSTDAVAIKEDKIVYKGNPSKVTINAKYTIDAEGLIVSPGFIDPHTHADRDLVIPSENHNKPFLFQGITTVIVGNDGNSFFPTSEYIGLYEEQGIGTNVIPLVGHGTIREQVMGTSDQKANDEDIQKMQSLMKDEMKAGAFGMSTGLYYSPGSYSNTEEVIALAKVVNEFDGIYDTHLRDESSYNIGLIGAIKEAIEIGYEANLPIHISHIKCLGVDVWNKSKEIIELIEKARIEGVDVTANQYPYDASATGLLSAVVPRWAESGGVDSLFMRYNDNKFRTRILNETNENIRRRGGPDKLLIVKANDSTLVGKTLFEISEMFELSPQETTYEALKSGFIRVASFNMTEEDIHNFMKQEWLVTGSDGNTGHPRKYGSFPRKYRKYVKEEEVISLSEFINNSTLRTAEIFRIKNRGKVKEGYYADIIIFDPKRFSDKATYNDAFELSEGLMYSIINGKIVVENEQYLDHLAGKVLTK